MGENGWLGLLIVNVIGFLTMIVTTIATSMKASAERKQAAEALRAQQQATRDEMLLKAKMDDERAERDRRWAREDREALAAKAERDARHMTSRIDGAVRKADLAFAVSNMGNGLLEDHPAPPPVASQRLKALAAARVTSLPPAPATAVPEVSMATLGMRQLFTPGQEDDDVSEVDATVKPP